MTIPQLIPGEMTALIMILAQSVVDTMMISISQLLNNAVPAKTLLQPMIVMMAAIMLIPLLMFTEILAPHGMTPSQVLADTTMIVISTLWLNAAPAVEDAILTVAMISIPMKMVTLMMIQMLNAPTIIQLEMLTVILAVIGMTPTRVIAVHSTPTLSIPESCAALVVVVAKEVRLALSTNLLMNGQMIQNSARTMTQLSIHMVIHAPNTTMFTQMNADYGIQLPSTLMRHAVSVLVVTSTMTVLARTMIQLLILMEILAPLTTTYIQKSVEDGILILSTLMINAALAQEEVQEFAPMTTLPLILMEILATTTQVTQVNADTLMMMISQQMNNAVDANHMMVPLVA